MVNNLYIVDNASEDQSVKKYLQEWCSISKQMDIATGYLEIGGLLALDQEWRQMDKIRIILGNEVTKRTKAVIDTVVKAILDRILDSIDEEAEKNEFLIGVPAILQIYENFQQKHKGESKAAVAALWNKYVDESLLPRLNGFELMMAPYAVAHMKLAMVLKDTGYDFSGEHRLDVFLTNSLEKAGNSDNQLTLFDDPLAMESVEVNKIKKNSGINVVIGNPPYNVNSTNKNDWIQALLADFKQGLTEKKLNLDDDYIKFIKLSQTIINGSGDGIIAFITNNSYIDGVSHRRIRESLLESFDQVYIIDLHGNVMKQEKCADGSRDENVFDIQQGVSIGIFVKKRGVKRFVKYLNLMGERQKKYSLLNSMDIPTILWEELIPENRKARVSLYSISCRFKR